MEKGTPNAPAELWVPQKQVLRLGDDSGKQDKWEIETGKGNEVCNNEQGTG